MRYGDYARVGGNALKTARCRISTCFALDGYMKREQSEEERDVAKGTVPVLLCDFYQSREKIQGITKFSPD
jgi:hypothetical protein